MCIHPTTLAPSLLSISVGVLKMHGGSSGNDNKNYDHNNRNNNNNDKDDNDDGGNDNNNNQTLSKQQRFSFIRHSVFCTIPSLHTPARGPTNGRAPWRECCPLMLTSTSPQVFQLQHINCEVSITESCVSTTGMSVLKQSGWWGLADAVCPSWSLC